LADRTLPSSLGVFVELTKPRALAMIVFTTCFSALIAATGPIQLLALLHLALGVGLAGGGALVMNQYMERQLDARMARTQDRPLPSGRIKPGAALTYALLLQIAGYPYLWLLVNPPCCLATMACGVSYLYFYTPLKLRTSFSSFVGAIPGGLLPVMGWTAARGRLEVGAWVLFVILFLWQIPHALIISIRHASDYAAVGMRQLPLVTSPLTCKRQMLLNILVLVPVSALPAFLNMTENVYPFVALGLGFLLFWQVAAFVANDTRRTEQRVFVALTAYLPLLLLAMYLDRPH